MPRVMIGVFLSLVLGEVNSMEFGVSMRRRESPSLLERKIEEARDRFIRGESIREQKGLESFHDDESVDILSELQKNRSWMPGPSVDDATKQKVANTINQRVLQLISQKDLKEAQNWTDVQMRFTRDRGSVSRNRLVIKKAQEALSRGNIPLDADSSFSFSPFYRGQ